MKFFSFFFFLLFVGSSFAQRSCKVTVNVRFDNINDGYDHVTKTQIFIDGKLIKESGEHKESEPNSFKLKVPRGEHELKIVNLTLYKGKWEETKVENEYSIDAFYESKIHFKKKKTINVLFDIDQRNPVVDYQ
ncbi:MAG: hypothetical protein EP338_14335 [Bacteroidetes bacterium]|nr:MAG: hypothetical protein EP338_14335 [Bacteroidota bacterium]